MARREIALLSIAVVVTACGGGGGSGETLPHPVLPDTALHDAVTDRDGTIWLLFQRTDRPLFVTCELEDADLTCGVVPLPVNAVAGRVPAFRVFADGRPPLVAIDTDAGAQTLHPFAWFAEDAAGSTPSPGLDAGARTRLPIPAGSLVAGPTGWRFYDRGDHALELRLHPMPGNDDRIR